MKAVISEKRDEMWDKLLDILEDKSFVLGVDAMCETEENVVEMLKYMDANPSATSSDIIDKGMLIYYENERKKAKKSK